MCVRSHLDLSNSKNQTQCPNIGRVSVYLNGSFLHDAKINIRILWGFTKATTIWEWREKKAATHSQCRNINVSTGFCLQPFFLKLIHSRIYRKIFVSLTTLLMVAHTCARASTYTFCLFIFSLCYTSYCESFEFSR